MLNQLSLKSKLLLMLLAVSVCSIAVVGYQSYRNGERIINRSIHRQLTSLREARASQLESYFEDIRNQVETLAEDRMIVDAMKEFQATYRLLDRQAIPDAQVEKLKKYYNNYYLPQLQKNIEGESVLSHYLPKSSAAVYLQNLYITQKINGKNKQRATTDADDKSLYSSVHQRYHSVLKKIVEKFGYDDLFLVDTDSTKVVYSVSKGVDFATSLATGPYSNSNFTDAIKAVQQASEREFATVVDFQAYRPSYGAPAAFIAAPVYDQQTLIGVLAFQISTTKLEAVMTGKRNWQRDGLGKSGEVYLVGKDGLMRSESRLLLEDPEQYIETLRTIHVTEETIAKIEHFNTSILLQPIKTKAVEEALLGKQGTRVIKNYHHTAVLSSYAPIHLKGLDWMILAEIDLEEANQPLYQFQKELVVSTSIIVSVVTVIAMFIAYYLTRPIHRLVAGVKRVSSGDTSVAIPVTSQDEFGQLADAFNDMVRSIHKQTEVIEEKSKENEALLLNILPTAIAKRVQEGERHIADRYSNVTVLFTTLRGFTEYSQPLEANEALIKLNEIITSFDETAEQHGVEKVKTVGYTYMAVCGLTIPRVDHAKRMEGYARAMFDTIRRFNRKHETTLSLRIGIHTGPVIAGIVGRDKFIYDLWGKTVTIADQARSQAQPGEIWITQQVYERLVDKEDFTPATGNFDNTPAKAWKRIVSLSPIVSLAGREKVQNNA